MADMEAHTQHLVELVSQGADLVEVARDSGRSAEHVRRILNLDAIDGRELPGRPPERPAEDLQLARELAPAVEAMWSEGMLYHEIAEVLDTSVGAVYRTISRRVPADVRSRQAALWALGKPSPEERLFSGMRKAAGALPDLLEGEDSASPGPRTPTTLAVTEELDDGMQPTRSGNLASQR